MRGQPLNRHFLFASIFLVFGHCTIAQKNLTARAIEKTMAKLNDTLYAGRYEVSNAEYNLFLNSIAKKDSALYWNYRSDSTKWIVVMQYCEPLTALWYHRHPAFADYPVVNISYEGAMAYCQWLTEIFNNDEKKKFKKVAFVLPVIKDWTFAAQGGKTGRMYPWGNWGMVNKKGMYLCNFKPVGDPYFVRDSLGNPVIVSYSGEAILHAAEFPVRGTFYTMKVKSFDPNDLGIYNSSGNAAEMTAIPGFAMGGSWNSYGGEIYTTSIKQYEYPSPEVGFRVFMKVIEP